MFSSRVLQVALYREFYDILYMVGSRPCEYKNSLREEVPVTRSDQVRRYGTFATVRHLHN